MAGPRPAANVECARCSPAAWVRPDALELHELLMHGLIRAKGWRPVEVVPLPAWESPGLWVNVGLSTHTGAVYQRVVAHRRHNAPTCNHQREGFGCSRMPGHPPDSRHMATGGGAVIAAWPGDHAPVLADLGEGIPE